MNADSEQKNLHIAKGKQNCEIQNTKKKYKEKLVNSKKNHLKT